MSARESVHHLVNLALDVGDLVTVLMMSMVQTGELAKVGTCMIRCEGTFPVPGDGCYIVVQCGEGGVLQIVQVVGKVSLCEYSCLL